MKEYDVVVLGAGMGGLAAAALWAQKGERVLLVESHYAGGGCAGYFKRKQGYYDVGATTLSGLADGRPVNKILKKLNLDLKTYHCNPGIKVNTEDEVFNFYASLDELNDELIRVFNLDCLKTLKKWQALEDLLWESLDYVQDFPNIGPSTIKKFFMNPTRKLLKHPKLFTSSFYNYLPKEMKKNKKFIRVLDQLLLISTQQTSKTCPAFMGILGFFYPLDTHAIEGGMWGLVKSLESKIQSFGGEIKYRSTCEKIEKEGGAYLISTNKEQIKCSKLISNISPEVFDSLFMDKELKQDKGKIWGAMTAYFSFSSKIPITELYQQVHYRDGSLFFSFSHPDDQHRSEGMQMVTVSTHVDCDGFDQRDDAYKNKKEKFKTDVLDAFNKCFKEHEIDEVAFDSVGTPLTFKHYTQRPNGEVGGLIHNSALSLLRLIPNKMKNENIYFVGDYTFPGQGIVSVFQSALNTIKE
ncbi:phytoene desaturase family protein [Halobacteriovorax sp.]|uniref:phytoene desaturase family protein n=1 Tax=Halobacteriovorax sp. TaxID=2020862 RepID=UPI003AF3153C